MTAPMLRRTFAALFLLASVPMLVSSVSLPNKPMREEQFWQIIEGARGHGGDEEHAGRLAARLEKLDAPSLLSFAATYDLLLKRANKGPVWAAGVLLNGGHGSDDGFLYFRHWLIGQGRSAYTNALSSPDSLASVAIQTERDSPTAEWESFGWTAAEVYRRKTQRKLHEDADQEPQQWNSDESEGWDWTQFEAEYMRESLPKLWSLYGHRKIEFDRGVEALALEQQQLAATTEVEFPGLGIIKAGIPLIHSELGAGTVLGVMPTMSGVMATIKFDSNVKHLHISPDTLHFFSRPNQ